MDSPLQFYFMHFMPYVHLPENHKDFDSLWVDLPNKYYDPAKGNALYNRYISEYVLADRLGFDGLIVNEHHGTVYSMMAAPNLIAATLIPQTKNAKICVWGTPPNLEYPTRLAEEYAMLDVLSGGRLEVAFPLGTGMEYWVHPISPVSARARHNESIELMLKAWTAGEPFTHDGEFYHYRVVNAWPRPMQQPYPKCYLVGSSSIETIEFAAKHGFGYSTAFTPHKNDVALTQTLRECYEKEGRTLTSDKLPIGCMLYVAETDAQAEEEYIPHIKFFFENCMRTHPVYMAPPGYIGLEGFRRNVEKASAHGGGFDWDMLTKTFRIAAGSPDTIADKVWTWMQEVGSSVVRGQLHLGDLPHWKTVKNITLFAEEVIPRIKKKAADAGVSIAAE